MASKPTGTPAGYLICYADGMSDLYDYALPEQLPRTLFRSVADAKKALADFSITTKASLVAYGQAFPYESVTFEQVLVDKGAAPYCWIMYRADDEDEFVRLTVYLITVYSG